MRNGCRRGNPLSESSSDCRLGTSHVERCSMAGCQLALHQHVSVSHLLPAAFCLEQISPTSSSEPVCPGMDDGGILLLAPDRRACPRPSWMAVFLRPKLQSQCGGPRLQELRNYRTLELPAEYPHNSLRQRLCGVGGIRCNHDLCPLPRRTLCFRRTLQEAMGFVIDHETQSHQRKQPLSSSTGYV